MADNLRVRLTKKMIKESFIELLEQRPLDKVSVAAICENAEINRATFYRYYDNPYDLYDKLESEFFDGAIEGMDRAIQQGVGKDTLYQTFAALLSYFKVNGRLLLAMRKHGRVQVLEEKMLQATYEKFSMAFDKSFGGLDVSKHARFRRYTGYGSAAIVEMWIENEMAGPVEDAAEFLATCAESLYSSLTTGQ